MKYRLSPWDASHDIWIIEKRTLIFWRKHIGSGAGSRVVMQEILKALEAEK